MLQTGKYFTQCNFWLFESRCATQKMTEWLTFLKVISVQSP